MGVLLLRRDIAGGVVRDDSDDDDNDGVGHDASLGSDGGVMIG